MAFPRFPEENHLEMLDVHWSSTYFYVKTLENQKKGPSGHLSPRSEEQSVQVNEPALLARPVAYRMTTAIVLDPMMGRKKNEKETVELDDVVFFMVILLYHDVLHHHISW